MLSKIAASTLVSRAQPAQAALPYSRTCSSSSGAADVNWASISSYTWGVVAISQQSSTSPTGAMTAVTTATYQVNLLNASGALVTTLQISAVISISVKQANGTVGLVGPGAFQVASIYGAASGTSAPPLSLLGITVMHDRATGAALYAVLTFAVGYSRIVINSSI